MGIIWIEDWFEDGSVVVLQFVVWLSKDGIWKEVTETELKTSIEKHTMSTSSCNISDSWNSLIHTHNIVLSIPQLLQSFIPNLGNVDVVLVRKGNDSDDWYW
jgi:hypothetical protein